MRLKTVSYVQSLLPLYSLLYLTFQLLFVPVGNELRFWFRSYFARAVEQRVEVSVPFLLYKCRRATS